MRASGTIPVRTFVRFIIAKTYFIGALRTSSTGQRQKKRKCFPPLVLHQAGHENTVQVGLSLDGYIFNPNTASWPRRGLPKLLQPFWEASSSIISPCSHHSKIDNTVTAPNNGFFFFFTARRRTCYIHRQQDILLFLR